MTDVTVRAIRGAIQLDGYGREEILEGTAELVSAVMSRNELTPDAVISVLFTVTHDLTAEFPALAARKIGFHDVPLMCAQEIRVPGAMPRVVRLMAHVETDRPRSQLQHVYLRGATALRLDIAQLSPGGDPRTRDACPMKRRKLYRAGSNWRCEPRMTLPRVLIIGAGLIGTSVALAVREHGGEVWLSDPDPATAQLAADMGAGVVVPDLRDAKGIADIALLAMPPAFVATGLAHAQECAVADVYTDVASVKSLPAQQARAAGCDLEAFVPGHPLAGREKHGPAAARADLFLGRTWALCPLPENAPAAVDAVTDLVVACGADPVRVDAATHDQWVALVSHAPHLVSVAMAARLAGPSAPAEALRLAGQGLRDVTRIAAGDPKLWAQIVAANAAPVAQILQAVADDLAATARALASGAAGDTADDTVARLLDQGRAGAARIPGKHGGKPPEFTVVQVVIADQPGELARLFAAAGAASVNIEDIRIEHSPGLPVGVAELSVRPGEVARLLDAMDAGGWPVRR
jgi:prephenate dehydrogenase